MSHRHLSQENLHPVIANASHPGPNRTRRTALSNALIGLCSGLIIGLLVGSSGGGADASQPDPKQTIVVSPKDIKWTAWSGLPEHSGEMATLYGDLNKPGPYLVLMKWYPGYFSAPHTYATDRVCVVVSGTWWVNSGKDFDLDQCVPVPAGGFVQRVARTPHYDGVKKDAKEPAVIAIFGEGPVDLKLVDPDKPSWRTVAATGTAKPVLGPVDTYFITQTALGNPFQVDSGRLAQKQGGTPAIRSYGELMVSSHIAVNDALEAISKKKAQVPPPTLLKAAYASMISTLEEETGKRFDTDYVRGQVNYQKANAALYQNEIDNGTDPDLKAFAQQTLPKIQDHLERALKLEKELQLP